jgi:hypothetical protein
MKEELVEILKDVRAILIADGARDLNLETIAKKTSHPLAKLHNYFKSDDDLMAQLLDFERHVFKEIFDKNDFDGINAIDIMMFVGEELSKKYDYITPSYSSEIKKYYPNVFEKHFQTRTDFIFEKIRINLTKGINQGMYRSDLSIELISRLYISRLWDIHNEDFFPPDKFSFDTLYQFMFDNLIQSIATEKGLKYYKSKINKAGF